MDTTAHPARIDGYAAALLDIARAEGEAEEFTDEFYRAVRALDANVELRDTLIDPRIPVGRKQGIVTELLGPRADTVTVAAVNFVVAAGQGKHLEAISSRLVELAAEQEGSVVAEVRSAVTLDSNQIRRLEDALSAASGKRVQAKVVTDPSILGGVVAKIGDTVFDGSVKSRFDEIREQWG